MRLLFGNNDGIVVLVFSGVTS